MQTSKDETALCVPCVIRVMRNSPPVVPCRGQGVIGFHGDLVSVAGGLTSLHADPERSTKTRLTEGGRTKPPLPCVVRGIRRRHPHTESARKQAFAVSSSGSQEG